MPLMPTLGREQTDQAWYHASDFDFKMHRALTHWFIHYRAQYA